MVEILKSIVGDLKIDHYLFTKRPEELSVNNFIDNSDFRIQN